MTLVVPNRSSISLQKSCSSNLACYLARFQIAVVELSGSMKCGKQAVYLGYKDVFARMRATLCLFVDMDRAAVSVPEFERSDRGIGRLIHVIADEQTIMGLQNDNLELILTT